MAAFPTCIFPELAVGPNGACPLGYVIDPATGCCTPTGTQPSPGPGNTLTIPSVFGVGPAPVNYGVNYAPFVPPAYNPAAPYSYNPSLYGGGLPPSYATGFASVIPVLEALLGALGGSLFGNLLTNPTETPTPPPPGCPCGGTKTQFAGAIRNSCGCWIAGGVNCGVGEYPPPCRAHEHVDAKTGCCAATCPAGEFAQPCRPNETIDNATKCCTAAPPPPGCGPGEHPQPCANFESIDTATNCCLPQLVHPG